VTLDGKSYYDPNSQKNDFYTTVEPKSGFMVDTAKTVSVYLKLDKAMTLPFPGLDKLAGNGQALIPVYDMNEKFSISFDPVRLTIPNS
jgi:hypothetical protein